MRLNPLLPSLLATLTLTSASPLHHRRYTHSQPQCRETKVAVLGAGLAGITAAQALAAANISDFLILEYTDTIGGRVAHTTFGSTPNTSQPYVVKLGANWVQGLVSPGGPENPIWTLAQKWNLTNTFSNYSDILTYDETGYVDYSDLLDDFETAYAVLEQDAGTILVENLQDRSVRTGLRLAGWNPMGDAHRKAVEWWEWCVYPFQTCG